MTSRSRSNHLNRVATIKWNGTTGGVCGGIVDAIFGHYGPPATLRLEIDDRLMTERKRHGLRYIERNVGCKLQVHVPRPVTHSPLLQRVRIAGAESDEPVPADTDFAGTRFRR